MCIWGLGLNAQNRFEGSGKDKVLILQGERYRSLSPSIFTNGIDTMEKLQHPLRGNPVKRAGYFFLTTIREDLAFKDGQCTSWQEVDIYQKIRGGESNASQSWTTDKAGNWIPIPQNAQNPKDPPINIKDSTVINIKDSTVLKIKDSLAIVYDSTKLKKPPVDTGSFWIAPYAWGSGNAYLNGHEEAILGAGVGAEVTIWNAKTSEGNISLDNTRFLIGTELGVEQMQTPSPVKAIEDDTCCFDWGDEVSKFTNPKGTVSLGVQFAPKRPLNDKQLMVSAMLAVSYRYWGNITSIPTTSALNRLSVNLGPRVDWGPLHAKLLGVYSPGLGLGWQAGLWFDFFKWAPKSKATASGRKAKINQKTNW